MEYTAIHISPNQLIERVARGVHIAPGAVPDVDFMWEDLVLTVKSIPNGVVCFISALAIYELTDEIPKKHWIAVPNATTIPKRKNIKNLKKLQAVAKKLRVDISPYLMTVTT